MKKNMGSVDKTVRVIIAIVLGILFYTNVISGTLGIILLILAGVFVLTSFISFCPLYLPFGISTSKNNHKNSCLQ
ncbi:YgaP family membrane protein [Polaribacter sp.]|uniref:YgaP family membrane protein n=1 Tax=Polaribacter sp. TaxID=1920175 RepID=UPI003F6BF9FF